MNKSIFPLIFVFLLSCLGKTYGMENTYNVTISVEHNDKQWCYSTDDIQRFKKNITDHPSLEQRRKNQLIGYLDNAWNKIMTLSAQERSQDNNNALAVELFNIETIVTNHNLHQTAKKSQLQNYVKIGAVVAGLAAVAYWQKNTIATWADNTLSYLAGKIVKAAVERNFCFFCDQLPSFEGIKKYCASFFTGQTVRVFESNPFSE